MSSESKPCHADITPTMWPKIDAVIATYRDTPGSVIAALRECQNIVGYLPVELIDYISSGLRLPNSSVYGVATFYSLFSLTPKGRHTIKLCLGTACYVKGIEEVSARIRNAFQLEEGGCSADRRFSLEAVRCLGACAQAPAMMVDEVVHGGLRSDSVVEVLERYS